MLAIKFYWPEFFNYVLSISVLLGCGKDGGIRNENTRATSLIKTRSLSLISYVIFAWPLDDLLQ